MCTFVVKTWKFKELLSHDSSVFRRVCIAKIPNSFLKFQDFHGIATDRRIEPFSLSEIRQNPPMCTFVVKTWKFKELLSHDSSVFRRVCIAKIPNSFLKFQDFHGIATDRRIEPFSLERRHLQGTGIQLEIRPVIHMARSCKFTMKTKQNCILLDGFLEVKNLIRCESGI